MTHEEKSREEAVVHLGLSRRALLTAGGAAVVGAAGGAAIARAVPAETSASEIPPTVLNGVDRAQTYPFYGTHQSGVETPAQMHSVFLGMNLLNASRQDAESVLRIVTDDAARMMAGTPALTDTEPEIAANPAGLTLTTGVGHSLFPAIGREDLIPAHFPVIPAFKTDAFEDSWGSTDFVVHIGSNDPLNLTHAVRLLSKELSTLTSIAWVQDGFLSAGPANSSGEASRNLMGQVDGTVNPRSGSEEFSKVVWIPEGAGWSAGGTVLVLRRLRMLMDDWDVMDRPAKELAIGRTLDTGAPLGGSAETDPMDFTATDDLGLPVIPMNAHARVAHAATVEEMILRRPFNYNNGFVNGKQDLGLLFAAYSADPRRSFIPMQERIAELDAFNRWNTTIGSATYLILPGVREGDFLGRALFA